jgi:hypothetical protein
LLNGVQLGATHWTDGDTLNGGQGAPIAGVACAPNENYHIHAHLAIFLNGAQFALPSQIGRVTNCNYDIHTHDRSGVVHVESDVAPTQPFTLGQLFAVWGEPLSNTAVAELTDPSIVAYINDNGTVQQWTGNIADIALMPHREITIQIGTALSALPTYDWSMVNP